MPHAKVGLAVNYCMAQLVLNAAECLWIKPWQSQKRESGLGGTIGIDDMKNTGLSGQRCHVQFASVAQEPMRQAGPALYGLK